MNKAAVVKSYPSKITILSFYSFFGTIQCAIVSLLLERDPSVWILRNDIDLIFVFYAVSTLNEFLNNYFLSFHQETNSPVFLWAVIM